MFVNKDITLIIKLSTSIAVKRLDFFDDGCCFFSLQLVHLASQDLPQIMPYLLRMGAMLLQLVTVCSVVVDQGVGSKSAVYLLSISIAVIHVF